MKSPKPGESPRQARGLGEVSEMTEAISTEAEFERWLVQMLESERQRLRVTSPSSENATAANPAEAPGQVAKEARHEPRRRS
jgi:hypothetical protein